MKRTGSVTTGNAGRAGQGGRGSLEDRHSSTNPDTAERAAAVTVLADFRHLAPAAHARVRDIVGEAVTSDVDAPHRFRLDWHEGRLGLFEVGRRRPFVIDTAPRRASGSDRLVRALGRGSRDVIDATAGFGGDAIHLARLGYRVIAVERCVVIAALLDDAIHGLDDALRARLTLIVDDAATVIARRVADVVYLDPMFRADRHKSTPRRAMTLARALAGDDEDAADLLPLARARCRRVVVKRADKAPPLADGVHHRHAGRTVRYDVYLDPAIGATT